MDNYWKMLNRTTWIPITCTTLAITHDSICPLLNYARVITTYVCLSYPVQCFINLCSKQFEVIPDHKAADSQANVSETVLEILLLNYTKT